jgi:hypothetical protein
MIKLKVSTMSPNTCKPCVRHIQGRCKRGFEKFMIKVFPTTPYPPPYLRRGNPSIALCPLLHKEGITQVNGEDQCSFGCNKIFFERNEENNY